MATACCPYDLIATLTSTDAIFFFSYYSFTHAVDNFLTLELTRIFSFSFFSYPIIFISEVPALISPFLRSFTGYYSNYQSHQFVTPTLL